MNRQNLKKQNTRAQCSDEEIIELYWQRNEQAIEETDRKYGKYLFTIAYNIVHNDPDSEECLNDTYLGTWNRIPPSRPSVFNVFLSRITRNIAVNKYKKETAAKRIPSHMTVPIHEIGTCVPEEMISWEEERAVTELGMILKHFLEELNDREQFIFVCRYYYSDTIPTIAKLLLLSEKTVSRELARMKEALRAELQKGGYSYDG